MGIDYNPERASFRRRLRQAVALPIYTIALILDYTAAALGNLAAWIAGDQWPE